MGARLDITGQRFGRLVALRRMGVDKHKHSVWECQCDCGKIVYVALQELRKGDTKSCGCLFLDWARNPRTIIGKFRRALYTRWHKMLQRCYNPRCPGFENYGGRGITVCTKWKNDFDTFALWAINNGFSPELTIERINNNDGYSPENCRWATRLEQARNKRAMRKSYLGDARYSLEEMSQACGIRAGTLQWRLAHGWSIDRAMQTPKRRAKKIFTYEGVPMSAQELEHICHIPWRTLYARYLHGWTVEDATTIPLGGSRDKDKG